MVLIYFSSDSLINLYMTGGKDHGESNKMWRNNMMVAHVSSSFLIGNKDDQDDGA